MLTEAWFPLRYHRKQSLLYGSRVRTILAAAGRGSGKTEISKRRVVRHLPIAKSWTTPRYFYGLPTRQQAKRIAWDSLLALIPASWIKGEPSLTDMRVKTVFGSELWVVGLDKPHRIEGDQWDGGVLDESCDQRPTTYPRSVLPALTHRDGWCLRIGVPKRHGVGAVEFKSACMAADGVTSLYLNWPSTDVIPEEKLVSAREQLDSRDFREQYLASWETASGLVFFAFDDVLNVQSRAYDPSKPLVIGSDFNVDPMCWVVMQRTERGLHVLCEQMIRDCNTPKALDALHARFGSHEAGVEFYGDATGRARKTAASASDYALIKADVRWRRKSVHYSTSNPSRRDRFASCNAMLLNAAGERRLTIDPKCTRLIADLRDRAYVEGSQDTNDDGDVGHMSDALGYPLHWLFPVTTIPIGVPKVMSR